MGHVLGQLEYGVNRKGKSIARVTIGPPLIQCNSRPSEEFLGLKLAP